MEQIIPYFLNYKSHFFHSWAGPVTYTQVHLIKIC